MSSNPMRGFRGRENEFEDSDEHSSICHSPIDVREIIVNPVDQCNLIGRISFMASRNLRNFYFDLLQTRFGLLLSWIFRSWNFTLFSFKQFISKFRAIWGSREFANLTFMLSDESRQYLPYYLAHLIGCSSADAEQAIRELENDRQLSDYYSKAVEGSSRRWSTDQAFKPGRLLLHYAIVRLTKPRFIFEAGLDKGFGAIILNRALQKNMDEGFKADYIGVEYRQDRPSFLIEAYPNRVGRIVYASWSDVFQNLAPGSVDFLFYDAVTFTEELEKFVALSDRFSQNAITICAWSIKPFYDIAERIERRASVFQAQAKDHWFEGNNLCVIYKPNASRLRFQ